MPSFFRCAVSCALLSTFPAPKIGAQAIQVQDAASGPVRNVLVVEKELPSPLLTPMKLGEVTLLPGLFRERRELAKAYLLGLQTEDVFQNHLLEAGVRIEKPYEKMNRGWDAPHCQLRGHFAGHWLSAASRFGAIDRDAVLQARVAEAVSLLKRCQTLNRGRWVGSVPEKYFQILAEGREPIWSPQYTLHKTMMGLMDAYLDSGNEEALGVLERAGDWFLDWTETVSREGHGSAVYGGECCGMLELWADLYAVTKAPRHLELLARYSMPELFRSLLSGEDPLSNVHANASIPWILGAARVYEVTGDKRYRDVVLAFWSRAVESRGMFATTGCNAGEYWIPPGQMGRFLGERTQEHCAVYNMLRVAERLFRWTGESKYADYIERALYNGILAQQNPGTGMVCYFLPLQTGAQKRWGSPTSDFWCCHGTLVQAQALFESLVFYRGGNGVTVGQFIPSSCSLRVGRSRVRIEQRIAEVLPSVDFSASGKTAHFRAEFAIASDTPETWTFRIRRPRWALGSPNVEVDGNPVVCGESRDGFFEIERSWKTATVRVTFAKEITKEALPGDEKRFAFLDGPVVLAAVGADDSVPPDSGHPVAMYEHQYVEGREWRSGHFRIKTRRGSLTLVPLYEIADERYNVYLSESP